MVVGERRRLEPLEPWRAAIDREPLEQRGREALAVEAVVDGERHLGDRGVDREVRGDGDRPQIVADWQPVRRSA